MSQTAGKLENISKQYRLGVVGTDTLSRELNRWYARIRDKTDPSLKIGQENILTESIIGKEILIEACICTPTEVCEKRDTKGLYAKARRGEIKNFTGISSPFEVPLAPDIDVNTAELTLEESTDKILDFLIKEITV